ncbi:uncharacterized protein C8Q71DRAFT_357010 [Rhodofomes roseus]|uniref:Uncharacterized protein n=1 Tax=Rhodofomes roseus TaxID=34475 RepID=A0ABQ8KT97_9APHY|nr:uncharacterized protein C8Q71DRAFT_357010 [Rhodofomes roseus]KAH9842028.1 hypothetical protein C8Q71DRAFT_357010 [Rhodofomes roseus]
MGCIASTMSREDSDSWPYNLETPTEPWPWHQVVLKLGPLSAHFPLLELTPDPNPSNTADIVVAARPWKSLGHGPIWVATERPAVQIGSGQLITLNSDGRKSGVGRLTVVTDLRRHWITWAIEGGPTRCNLRLPIPWARLSADEAERHTTGYHKLNAIPPPQSSFILDPYILYPHTSPYEFEIAEATSSTPAPRKKGVPVNDLFRFHNLDSRVLVLPAPHIKKWSAPETRLHATLHSSPAFGAGHASPLDALGIPPS